MRDERVALEVLGTVMVGAVDVLAIEFGAIRAELGPAAAAFSVGGGAKGNIPLRLCILTRYSSTGMAPKARNFSPNNFFLHWSDASWPEALAKVSVGGITSECSSARSFASSFG